MVQLARLREENKQLLDLLAEAMTEVQSPEMMAKIATKLTSLEKE